MARRRADACYRELGAELRKRRIAANLTMRELAYHLDWSPSTVPAAARGEADQETDDEYNEQGLPRPVTLVVVVLFHLHCLS